MGRFVGVDLHRNSFLVCFFDAEKGEKKFRNYYLCCIRKFLMDLEEDDLVAVEATVNARFFKKEVEKKVGKVIVVDPYKFKVISESVKKTDKRDAELIAFYLSKGMLPEVRMKKEEIAEVESLAHTRDKLVKLRTALKNKVHNILRMYGIETNREFLSSEKGLEQALSYEIGDTAKVELKVCIDQIRSLTKSIEEIEETLVNKGKNMKGFKNITSIKGIGEKSGTILLSVIGDINDFKSRKQLDAYFGIVPRVNNSNETIRHGKITKRGSKLGRTTLVQCALIAIKYSKYLAKYYNKLKAKKGSGKAIIATARKLLGIIYDTLKYELEFEDFSNFVFKTA